METPSQSRVRTPSSKPFKQKKKKLNSAMTCVRVFQDYDILGITTSLQTYSIVHLKDTIYFGKSRRSQTYRQTSSSSVFWLWSLQ